MYTRNLDFFADRMKGAGKSMQKGIHDFDPQQTKIYPRRYGFKVIGIRFH